MTSTGSPTGTRIAALKPWRATPGGRIHIAGGPFVLGDDLPTVLIGDVPVRASFAASTWLAVIVPPGVGDGTRPVRVGGVAGETAYLDAGVEIVTGVHAVDNPAIDADGNVYVTCSGSRGQETPVSIYRVTPAGRREICAMGVTNATSLAFDPQGVLHATSRFDGTVVRVDEDGTTDVVASDLGIACGLVFAPDGTMFVGDRDGTVHRRRPGGDVEPWVTLPPSMAAYHIALHPDGSLFVSVPTLSPCDAVYRVDPDGHVDVAWSGAFGRPQGLAFDAAGDLFVIEALAGRSGLYRVPGGGAPELVVAGEGLVGVAFDRDGGFVLASDDTVWRFPAALAPLA